MSSSNSDRKCAEIAQRLVEKARMKLIRKARERKMYLLERRVRIITAGPQREVWGPWGASNG
jgi:ribosomal protein L32E